MTSLIVINQLIVLYLGLFFFILGIFGSILQVFILTTVRYYRTTPCTFYFIIAAVHECGVFLTGIGPLIVGAALNIDLARTSIVWRKLRYFFITSFCAISTYCACLATINQFLITSQHIRFRQLSNMKNAHRASQCAAIIWWAHGTI